MCSSADFNTSDSKLLLDELYKVYNENEDGLNCSTCAKLILKLSKHVRNTHSRGGYNAVHSDTTKSELNLPSRQKINYSDHVHDSILQTPCDVLPSATAVSTSTSNKFSSMDITIPQIKMEDLDVEMDTDYPDYPDLGGSEEEETKIDINYLTGADVVTTTVAPENITVIPSSTIRETKFEMSCPICKKKYSSAEKLNVHLQKLHPWEKSYNCRHTNCGKKFIKESELKVHSKLHTEEKPFSCDICMKSFSQKVSLRRHKLVHSKPFICDECGKGFTKKIEVEIHKRAKHTGEKPFTCTICGKGFAGSNYLYLHMTAVHSEEMVCIICEVCGKSYKTKTALNSHMIVHSGQKSFVCDVCGKGFFYKHELERHTNVHTSERPFTCDICPKTFKVKSRFLTHMRTHTGERPYI